MGMFRPVVIRSLAMVCAWLGSVLPAVRGGEPLRIRTGTSAFTDYRTQRPGVSRRITVADLPAPDATRSVDNGPRLVPRPAKAWPMVPPGFNVELFATGLENPRLLRTAPNGDVFVAESRPGRVKVFRGMTKGGAAQRTEVFAEGLHQPFGIAFYPPGPDPQWVYLGDTRRGPALPLPKRRSKGAGPARACGGSSGRWSAARGRALDPRSGLLPRRQEAVRLRGIPLQCGRYGQQPRRVPSGRYPRIQSRWLRSARLCLGDPQPRGHRRASQDRRAVGLGERTRRSR